MLVEDVISKVKALFKDQDDLLNDFKVFLPQNSNKDANNNENFLLKVQKCLGLGQDYEEFNELLNQWQTRDKKFIDFKLNKIFGKYPEMINEFYKYINYKPEKKKNLRLPPKEKDEDYESHTSDIESTDTDVLSDVYEEEEPTEKIDYVLSNSERNIFERVKYVLKSPERYKVFLKVLNLFTDVYYYNLENYY